MVGLAAAEIEGKSAREVFPKKLAEKYYMDDLEVINSRSPKMNIEEQFFSSSDELRWVSTDKIPWFDQHGNLAGVLVFAVDITERKRAEEALRENRAKLRAQSEDLKETNAALKVLIKQREEDRTELEESLLRNVKHLILPYLEKLKRSRLENAQKNFIEIMEAHLREITSPFVHKISAPMLGLTPSEIRVADLIRQGKGTKEISDLLGISERSVIFHRQGIRQKLSLTGKKLNLQTYLNSLG